MNKTALITLASLAMTWAANAGERLPGMDPTDRLSEASRAVETGADFSYARQWGAGRAYDGTDTSGFVDQMRAKHASNLREISTSARTDFITRPADNPEVRSEMRVPLRGRLSQN